MRTWSGLFTIFALYDYHRRCRHRALIEILEWINLLTADTSGKTRPCVCIHKPKRKYSIATIIYAHIYMQTIDGKTHSFRQTWIWRLNIKQSTLLALRFFPIVTTLHSTHTQHREQHCVFYAKSMQTQRLSGLWAMVHGNGKWVMVVGGCLCACVCLWVLVSSNYHCHWSVNALQMYSVKCIHTHFV